MRQTSSADKYFCESRARAESGVQIIPATKSVSEPDQEIVMLYYETPGQWDKVEISWKGSRADDDDEYGDDGDDGGQ